MTEMLHWYAETTDPCGKYLIFFSHKGREVLADKFGAPFVSAVRDVCTTTAFAREDLAAMAAQELNALAQKVRTRLGLTLTALPAASAPRSR